MKRFVGIVLALVLCLGLAACGNTPFYISVQDSTASVGGGGEGMYTVKEIAEDTELAITKLLSHTGGGFERGGTLLHGDNYIFAELDDQSAIYTRFAIECASSSALSFLFQYDVQGYLKVVLFNDNGHMQTVSLVGENGSGFYDVDLEIPAGNNYIAFFTQDATGEYKLWNLECEGASRIQGA